MTQPDQDLPPDAVVAPSSHVVWTDASGEYVILNPRSGMYHGVSGVGSVVWTSLVGGSTVAALEGRVRAEYEVDAAQCRADLRRFLHGLRERGLVEVRGAAAP